MTLSARATVTELEQSPALPTELADLVTKLPTGDDRSRLATRRPIVRRLAGLPFGLQASGFLSALLALQYWPILAGDQFLPTHFLEAYPGLSANGSANLLALKSQAVTDLTTQQYPWQAFDAAALRSGHLPLWDPHVLMGVPQVASWLPAVFDPFHIGYLFLPVMVWWNLLFPIHQLVAGLGAALLARRLTRSRLAGLVAGMMYGFSGYIVGHNGQNQGEVACLLPFLLLAVLWLGDRPSVRRALPMALVLAAMVLAGHPETLFFSCVSAAAIAFTVFLRSDAGTRWRFVASLGVGGFIALGCSAIQWIPGISWLRLSARVQMGALDVHAARVGLLDFFSRDATSATNSVGILQPSASSYLSIGGIVLALFGLLRWRQSAYVPVFALLGLLSGLVAFGIPPLYPLATHVPLLRGMRLDFLLMVTDLSLALLAAHGLVRLREAGAVRRMRGGVGRMYAVAVAFLVAGTVLLAAETHREIGLWFSFVHGPLAAVLLSVCTLVLVLPSVIRRRIAVVLLVALIAVDLSTWSLGYRQFAPASTKLYRTPPVVAALKALDPSRDYRILDAGRTLPLNFALPSGIEDPLGYGPYETETLSYWSGLTRQPRQGHMSPLPRTMSQQPDHRLDLADVKYVFVAAHPHGGRGWFRHAPGFRRVLRVGGVVVFQNLHDLGPAVVVPMTGVQATTGDQAVRLVDAASFSPRREAVVNTAPAKLDGQNGSTPSHPSACGCVSDFQFNGDTTSFDVSARQASLAVVSQSWYPGWHATVNGHPVTAAEADVTLTGVPVPAGRSRIVLRFQPSSQSVGIDLTLSTLALVLVSACGYAAVLSRRRQGARQTG